MGTPLVTILIDTYNHETFIQKAVQSVLAQDFPESSMEILVVDDGSTDRTPEIVRQFAPRVRLIRKPNGGQASAFNVGVAEARAEIVAFLDGDDWWAPNKLTRVTQAFAANPEVGFVGHGITEVLHDGSHRVAELHQETRFQANTLEGARLFRTRKNFLGTSRMSVRTDLLRKILPVPESLVIQADEYIFTMAAVFSPAIILPDALTYYRHHSSNLFIISANDPAKFRAKLQVLQDLYKSLSEKLQQVDLDPQARKAILEALEIEATHMRLTVDGGWPWETVSMELKLMRILHGDASIWQNLFSCARLVPSLVIPPKKYYQWRQKLAQTSFYQRVRRRFFPFPVPSHTKRVEKSVR
jgi:glycosyltransferase involved in cell wall biosynthesis